MQGTCYPICYLCVESFCDCLLPQQQQNTEEAKSRMWNLWRCNLFYHHNASVTLGLNFKKKTSLKVKVIDQSKNSMILQRIDELNVLVSLLVRRLYSQFTLWKLIQLAWRASWLWKSFCPGPGLTDTPNWPHSNQYPPTPQFPALAAPENHPGSFPSSLCQVIKSGWLNYHPWGCGPVISGF